MATSKITLMGFAEYFKNRNGNLFARLTLPDGINKGDFTNSLLLRAGEFEVLYSNPLFMQEAIAVWGKKWYNTFNKWYTALNIEYEPLYNYDRTESWNETENVDEKITEETAENEQINKTRDLDTTDGSSTNSTASSNTETENKISAFNSSSYEPNNTNTSDLSSTAGSTVSETGTEDETETEERENSRTLENNRDNDRTFTRNGRAYGNIGVTTSQQMLQQELDIAKWCLYDQMSDVFIQEFCIPVY